MASVNIKLNQEKVSQLQDICKEFNNDKGELINVLHKAQHLFGYLPAEVQEVIAQELKTSAAHVYGVVTFYSFFTMKPRGDHNIRVCIGTACYVKGIEKIVHKINETLKIAIGETTENRKFSLEGVRCLGACGLAPVMMIDQETYGALTASKALSIIGEYDPAAVGALAPTQEEEMAEKEA